MLNPSLPVENYWASETKPIIVSRDYDSEIMCWLLDQGLVGPRSSERQVSYHYCSSGGTEYDTMVFRFKYPRDRMLFKLTWGGL